MSPETHNPMPLFQLPLRGTNWSIIFTSNGSHYYHNIETKASKWVLDETNEEEAHTHKLIDTLNKDMLVVITAKARGLALDEALDQKVEKFLQSGGEEKLLQEDHGEETETISDSTQQALDYLLGNSQQANLSEGIEEKEEESDEPEEEKQVKKPKTSALIGGYSSSEEDDSDEEEEHEVIEEEVKPPPPQPVNTEREIVIEDTKEPSPEPNEEYQNSQEEESSDEENGIDINDLLSSSSEDEDDEDKDNDNEGSRTRFTELLEEAKLDPYNPWEMESTKILEDPRFFEIADNAGRKAIFDAWSREVIERLKTYANENDYDLLILDNEEEDEDEDILKYFKFLHKKRQSSELGSFFKQFKTANSGVLSSFDIPAKEIETKYKEFLMYSKKSYDDLIKTFQSFMKSQKFFKKNLIANKDKVDLESWRSQLDGNEDTKKCEKLIREIERTIEISESIRFNTKYQILDPAIKAKNLIELISGLL